MLGLRLTTMTLALWSGAAHAQEEVDWRNEEPGFGVGLGLREHGPTVRLRGWSSAALSVDLEGGWMRVRERTEGSLGSSDRSSQRVWAGVAPRVRVWSSARDDLFLVPSARVEALDIDLGGATGPLGTTTTIRAAAGLAYDRWLAPGISFTGQLDLIEASLAKTTGGDRTASASTTRLGLTPSVAVHVYPWRRQD